MSLIIALGSNMGDRLNNLKIAKWILSSRFEIEAASQVYTSTPVDYLDQPDFLNQVLQFKRPPHFSPIQILDLIQEIETILGRTRTIDKGPRIIDIDLIFVGTEKLNTPRLTIPHPRWAERSFVVRPLSELPFYQELIQKFSIEDRWEEAAAFPLTTSC